MLLRFSLATALLAFVHHAEAAEEAEATNLCRGDAFRLCMNEIPDRERITACLQRRRADLSPGCQTMFAPTKATPAAQTAGR